MQIPVENIYYLLCYAWNKLEERGRVQVSIDDQTMLLDLLAKVLISGTKVLLKRGIDRDYISYTEEMAGIKGKLQLGETLKKGLQLQQRTICCFDDYLANTLLNQILVTTLYRLVKTEGLDGALKKDIKRLVWMFPEVTKLELTTAHFSAIRLNRNNRFYGFLLQVCQLVFESSLPSERAGMWSFMDFTRDEAKMSRLFEAFLFNFYRVEQSMYRVRREIINWKLEAEQGAYEYLPKMCTDITLENKEEKIIIDAKYYRETLSMYYGKESIKSANLYQLFSYLLNQQQEDTPKTILAKGILLYPTIESEYDLAYKYGQHSIYIKTVNLNMPWPRIESRLKAIIDLGP